MKSSTKIGLIILTFIVTYGWTQAPVDGDIVARIKMEAFQNSQIMETLFYLTDVHGPRLTGSENLRNSAEWAKKQLASWGIKAKLEEFGPIKPGWKNEFFSLEMLTPFYKPLIGFPKAWTPSTDGKVSGTPVIVHIKSTEDIENYRGKLKGKIVFNGVPNEESPTNPNFEADAQRISDEKLEEYTADMGPAQGQNFAERRKKWAKWRKSRNTIYRFFREEGIAALVDPSSRDHNLVRVGSQSYSLGADSLFPALVMSSEQYGRIYRLIEKDLPVELGIESRNITTYDTIGYNLIAEIQGNDLDDEVVMIGGHLDSWHSGTGATDNAGSCAVMMEVLRIFKKLNFKPRRTIRMGLWIGEEQGFIGSSGYIQKHFGDSKTMKLLPEHENFSAYYNLDNGSGKIRGIYLQGNERVRPLFEEWLKPFHYLGAKTVTAKNTGGTDHVPFNRIGLPGFQFIQDPIEYGTRTHHSSIDVYESVLEDDLKQAAAIIATFVYQTAMRDELMPRKPLPKP